jgi:phosphomevalonate kinase
MTRSNNDEAITSVTVSAPGKVLLAGGYLVLESPNTGLVIAANKRFYCTIELKGHENNDSLVPLLTTIVVKSPQFHSTWEYHALVENGDSKDAMSLSESPQNESKNEFVEKTLRVTLAYIIASGKQLPAAITLTIRADNDFYSVVPHLEGKERTPASVESLPRFLPCPQDQHGKAIVHKTGLGSSAALVTSVVGALLQSFTIPLDRVHNLAQICHCHAQGKVGSGFDVSAAVFGSHVYTKFPTHTLAGLLQELQQAPSEGNFLPSTVTLLCHAVETAWEGGVVEGIELPYGVQLVLADVCGGSESPSMARQVLAWKETRTALEEPYWEELAALNPKIVDLMKQQDLAGLKIAFHEARVSLKKMGEAAGVPIEPDEQTAVADATSLLEGVLCCVVPGAGGYDALACLYQGGDATKDRIGKLWAEWSQGGTEVCPLAVEAGLAGDGLRVENNFTL